VGAGRPRKPGSGVPHLRRTRVRRGHPVHVTLRLHRGLPTLRQKRAYHAVYRAFVGGCSREGFRLVHYSVQRNHLHLLVEARDAQTLARSMQGLCVRLARKLNRLFVRTGALFADRYHARSLKSPREVRNALRYVLCNARRHRSSEGGFDGWLDPYSSGVWFDGWRGARGVAPAVFGLTDARAGPLGLADPRFTPKAEPETAPARWYLLRRGWRRHGLIEVDAQPGTRWQPRSGNRPVNAPHSGPTSRHAAHDRGKRGREDGVGTRAKRVWSNPATCDRQPAAASAARPLIARRL
jgi:REP element-mobilizing transposase RayT